MQNMATDLDAVRLSPRNKDLLKKFVADHGGYGAAENFRIYEKFFPQAFEEGFPEFLAKYGIFERRVLDVGCCYGQHLLYLSEDSVGMEALPKLVDFSRSLGLNVLKQNAEDKWRVKEKFEIVYSRYVLNHLVSPQRFFHQAWQALSKDGLLVINVDNSRAPFNYAHASDHLYLFDADSLSFMAQRSGFDVVGVRGSQLPIPNFLNALLSPLSKRVFPSLWLVARKDTGFKYAEKRVSEYTPSWMRDV